MADTFRVPTSKRALLFVGANLMGEIQSYIEKYDRGIFIEPIPQIYEVLKLHLENTNRYHNTKFIAHKALVTSEDDKEYDFNVFSNYGASSSIYEPNEENWEWKDVKPIGKMKLRSTKLSTLLDSINWSEYDFDAVIDVQGAELEVLKGAGIYLKHIRNLTIEYSKKEYYRGGVLFDELDKFLTDKGFERVSDVVENHYDVKYINRNI